MALLGEGYRSQLRENPNALKDVQVVWVGTSLELLLAEVPRLRPDVLALDFRELEEAEAHRIPELLEQTRARLAVVTYRIARKRGLEGVPEQKVRLLPGPLPLSLLRVHIHLGMLDSILTKGEAAMGPEPQVKVTATPRAPRFTDEQLGRLLEMSSTVQCECPNHVSGLVSKLRAFEEYSKSCESRNAADQQMHALLYRYSAAARVLMEEALEALLKHENIRL